MAFPAENKKGKIGGNFEGKSKNIEFFIKILIWRIEMLLIIWVPNAQKSRKRVFSIDYQQIKIFSRGNLKKVFEKRIRSLFRKNQRFFVDF